MTTSEIIKRVKENCIIPEGFEWKAEEIIMGTIQAQKEEILRIIREKLDGLSDYHLEERYTKEHGNYWVLKMKDGSEFATIDNLNEYKRALNELKWKIKSTE